MGNEPMTSMVQLERLGNTRRNTRQSTKLTGQQKIILTGRAFRKNSLEPMKLHRINIVSLV